MDSQSTPSGEDHFYKQEAQKQKAARTIEPIKIFYCYATQDRGLRDELEKHLMSLKRLRQITLQLTREILAGTDWSLVEDQRFQSADLILLLISPDFISSDYHYGREMHNALEKHDAGNVWVIPIILRPTSLWEDTPLGRLQALPKTGEALTSQSNRDAAFVDVVKEISEVVAILLRQKQKSSVSTKMSKRKAPGFTRIIGPSCLSCGTRNPLGASVCDRCGDILIGKALKVSLRANAPAHHRNSKKELASALQAKTEELASVVEIYNELFILNDLTFQSFQRMEEARKISTGELENATKKIIESLLAAATTLFDDDIFSGALFRLDASDNKLKIWAHDRMLQEDVDTIEFDMSPNIKPPVGMARAAYWHRKPEMGHIERNRKEWWCTNNQYIPMGAPLGSTGGQRRSPLYASLICVPALHRSHQHPLGVVAFHSKEKTTFDDPKINQIVERIVDLIAHVLIFYDFLTTVEFIKERR